MDSLPDKLPFFEVEGLHQSLEGQGVLRGVSFSAAQGKTTVILGGSGAGKSVLLRHLNGLMKPIAGTVKVMGRDIGPLSERDLRPIRRSIGVLFQDGALFDSMDVSENIAFPLREGGERDESAIAARVEETLSLVGLHGHERKRPDALSGGMRKRVSLARAIAARPDCLLYDEPTAGLDPLLSENITRLIARLKDEMRLTSVMVTHNLGAMRFVADHVIFLNHGRVLYAGEPEGLEDSTDEAIRNFLDADALGRE